MIISKLGDIRVIYGLVIVVALILSFLVLEAGTSLLPADCFLFVHCTSMLLGGSALAGLVLLVLISVQLVNKLAGRIVTGFFILGWLLWILIDFIRSLSSSFSFLLIFGTLGLVSFVVFAGAVHVLASLLLPLEEKKKHRWDVIKLLKDFITGENLPCYIVSDEHWEDQRIQERIKGNPFNQFADGPSVVISDCVYAIEVSNGVNFRGVKGPGVVFMGRTYRPKQALDLRPQLRTFTVRALTLDGIEIEVLCFAPAQINRGETEPELGEPFPYRRSAAFLAIHSQEVEHTSQQGKSDEERKWYQLPAVIGTRIMQDLISQRRFDELYGPYDREGPFPRKQIAGEFVERLGKELAKFGIQLVGGGISNIKPVRDDVLQQRLSAWQADWSRRILRMKAKGQAEWLKKVEQARGQAQADLIMSVGERLGRLDQIGAEVTASDVMPQFLDFLEELALTPRIRQYLPPNTVQEIRRMQANSD